MQEEIEYLREDEVDFDEDEDEDDMEDLGREDDSSDSEEVASPAIASTLLGQKPERACHSHESVVDCSSARFGAL